MPRERDLPDKAICLDCGQGFKLIHNGHLRTHGYKNQEEYRDNHGLGSEIPLHSKDYSVLRSYYALQPQNITTSRTIGQEFQRQRWTLIEALAERGLFTASTAATLTGIPRSTLQSAMREEGRLPYGLACLRISTVSGSINGGLAKITQLGALYQFVKTHKPKKRT